MATAAKKKRVTIMVAQYLLQSTVHMINLDNAINRLLCKERFLDVTLTCEGLKFQCHRLVLAAASPLFEELLVENATPHPIVILPATVRATTLKTLIDFIYKGRTNVGQYILSDLVEAASLLQIIGITEGQPQFTFQEIEIEQEVDDLGDEVDSQEPQSVQPQDVIEGVLSYRIEQNNDPELQRQIQETIKHQQALQQQQAAQQRVAHQLADRQQAAILKAVQLQAEKEQVTQPQATTTEETTEPQAVSEPQVTEPQITESQTMEPIQPKANKRQPRKRQPATRQQAPRQQTSRIQTTQQQTTQTVTTRKRAIQPKPTPQQPPKQITTRQQTTKQQIATQQATCKTETTVAEVPAHRKRRTSQDRIIDYIEIDDSEDSPPTLEEPTVEPNEIKNVVSSDASTSTETPPSTLKACPQYITVISSKSDMTNNETTKALQTIAINRPLTQQGVVTTIPGIRVKPAIKVINLLQLTGPRPPGLGQLPTASGQLTIPKFAPFTYIHIPVSSTQIQATPVQTQPSTLTAQTQPSTSTTLSHLTTPPPQMRPSTPMVPVPPSTPNPQMQANTQIVQTPSNLSHLLRGPPQLTWAPHVNPDTINQGLFAKPQPVFKPPPPPAPLPEYMRTHSIAISSRDLDRSATQEKLEVINMAAIEAEEEAKSQAATLAAETEIDDSDVKTEHEDIELGDTKICEADFPMFYAMMKKDIKERKAREKENARRLAEVEAELAREARVRAEVDSLTEEQKIMLREKMYRDKAEMAARYQEQMRLQREEHARLHAEAVARAEAVERERAEIEKAAAAARAEEEARAKAQAEAKAKAQAEENARAQAEAQLKARQAQARARAQAQARNRAQAKVRAQARVQAEAIAKAKAPRDPEPKAVMDTEAENIICQPNLSFICDCKDECDDNELGVCIDYERLMTEPYGNIEQDLKPVKQKRQPRKKQTKGKKVETEQKATFFTPDFLQGPKGRKPKQPPTTLLPMSVNTTTSGPEDLYFHDKLLFTEEENKKFLFNNNLSLETLSISPPPPTREGESHSPQTVILRNPRCNQPRHYSTDSLYRALMDVKHGESIYRSSQHHQVPRKTLRNWMKRWDIKSQFPMPKQLKDAALKKKEPPTPI